MTVDEYLRQAPEPQRSTLGRIRASLRRILPEADEALSYGVPAFKVGGTPVAGYAFFTRHCSYFPHSGSVLSEIADELSGYEWSKGTLKFPVDEPLPESILVRLVEVRLGQIGRT
jgi:uncharacterized protein YdhG (YjbR/CyaY superfamily)